MLFHLELGRRLCYQKVILWIHFHAHQQTHELVIKILSNGGLLFQRNQISNVEIERIERHLVGALADGTRSVITNKTVR